MRILAIVMIGVVLSCTAYAADLDNWPGKSEGLGPPYYSYNTHTCGDFVRAQEGSASHQYLMGFLSGYISGINSERRYGGNVLGKDNPKIADFALMVRRYCAEHPTEPLGSGIGASLKNLKPATWRDMQ
jgi:hypothetical protein